MQAGALKAARERAEELTAGERAELDAMRTRNAELLASAGDFIEQAEPAPTIGEIDSPVARGLASVPRTRAKVKDAAADLRKVEQAARDALLSD